MKKELAFERYIIASTSPSGESTRVLNRRVVVDVASEDFASIVVVCFVQWSLLCSCSKLELFRMKVVLVLLNIGRL